MSIVDRLFAGKVVKDFGLLEQKSLGIGKSGKGVLLVEKRGELYLALKSFAWALFGGSVRYDTFKLANAYKLREFIGECEQISRDAFPRDYVGRINWPFTGNIVRDFGFIEQEGFPLGKMTKKTLLVERDGELSLVLKFSQWALLSWGVSYQYFSLEDAYKLRGFVDESEKIAASLPPSTYDPRVEANRRSLLTAAVGSAVLLFVRGMNSTVVAALILLWVCAGQMWMLWRYQGIRSFIVRRCALLLLFMCAIVGAKTVLMS